MVNLFLVVMWFWSLEGYAARICRACDPQRYSDLVHRDSTVEALFVGHTGLFVGEQIVDVAVGRAPGKALAIIPFNVFKRGGDFWGAKAPKALLWQEDDPSWEQFRHILQDKIDFFRRTGVEYDYVHLSQKGKKTTKGRFLFDCVGFTEHVWEYLGFDITPHEFESEWGWPLTVREQRDSSRLQHVRPSGV